MTYAYRISLLQKGFTSSYFLPYVNVNLTFAFRLSAMLDQCKLGSDMSDVQSVDIIIRHLRKTP